MIFETVIVSPMEVNCYILASKDGGKAIIIDPGSEQHKIRKALDRHRLTAAFVINTHGHFDHIGCDDEFGVPVYIHSQDMDMLKDAKKNFVKVSLKGNTVPHQIFGECRTTKVVLVPAAEGTGVIAGSAVRAVVECAGIKDLLSKVYGSTNPINVVKAALDALKKLRTSQEVTQLRGVEVAQ